MGPPIVEGWMYRFGRHTLGRSYFHKRYFVLDRNILAYYKKKPAQNDVPIRSLHLDDNCRVEDRGLETHHGHWVYVLSVYKRQSSDRITLAALSNQDATVWKQNIQQIIDSANAEQTGQSNGNAHGTPGPASPKGRHTSLLDQQSSLTEADFPSARHLGDVLHLGENGGGGGGHGVDGLGEMPSPLSRHLMSSDEMGKEETERLVKGPLLRAETVGRGTPRELAGWDLHYDEEESVSSPRHPSSGHAGGRPHRRHWRLVGCSNSLRVFEEIPEPDQASKLRAMKSVGVVEATCENVFELVIAMDELRFEWDVSFMGGRVVEEVDGHTAVVHMWFGNDWLPSYVCPRDLCFVRYWRRNEDGTYVILSRSIEHQDCPPQPGFVRAQLESGGWIISPLKSRGGVPRSRVQCLVQLDVNFGPLGGLTSFPRHTINQWLMSVAGMREFFAARDGDTPLLVRVPHNMGAGDTTPLGSGAASCLTGVIRVLRPGDSAVKTEQHVHNKNQNREEPVPSDSDDDEDQAARAQGMSIGMATPERVMRAKRGVAMAGRGGDEPSAPAGVPVSAQKLAGIQFPGTFQQGDHEKGQNCWSICEPSTFRVRSRRYLKDKSKVAAKRHLMQLVAVDWLKAKRRIDHVAQCKGTAAQVAAENNLFSLVVNVQVPASGHYSMVFYFVAEWPLLPGSLLQRFVDGTDRFRNARLKLIPAVPKGPWIVRQSVGTTPCLLGKALECTYHSSEKYLEIDVDIGSSTVANGVLGLVFGYVTSLAVDMAFLIEATGEDELPEELLSAVRISRMRLDAAVPPPEDHEAFGDHPKKA